MYAVVALLLLGGWYFLSQVQNVTGGFPYMLLAAALLAIAMHVLRRGEHA
jgi:hypothetical protein